MKFSTLPNAGLRIRRFEILFAIAVSKKGFDVIAKTNVKLADAVEKLNEGGSERLR